MVLLAVRLEVLKSVPRVRIHFAPPKSRCEPIPVVASFRGLNENRVIGKVHARTPDHADKVDGVTTKSARVGAMRPLHRHRRELTSRVRAAASRSSAGT